MLVLLLVACGGGLSEGDAEVLLGASSTVNSDTYGSLYSGAATGGAFSGPSAKADTSVTWDSTQTGGTFEGELTGTAFWTGTVKVSGSYEANVDLTLISYVWDVEMEYVDVTWSDTDADGNEVEYTLNGPMTMSVDSEIDATAMSVTYAQVVVGDLDVDGSAKGSVEFDYTLTAEVVGASATVTAEGSVGGYDVSYTTSY